MRLVTRADFDGLACAALLADLGLTDERLFLSREDVQDGRVPGLPGDVLCDVPFVPGCGYWFAPRAPEPGRGPADGADFRGAARSAPSCARLVREHFARKARPDGHPDTNFDALLTHVDKLAGGDLNLNEVLHPTGWILLGFLLDPFTGLARSRDFARPDAALLEMLVEPVRTLPVEDVLALPDVAERAEHYFRTGKRFKTMLLRHIEVRGNVLLLDTRDLAAPPPGNRFAPYALFPECNVSIRLERGPDRRTRVSAGRSILNRTCGTDLGALLRTWGGDGSPRAGSCLARAEAVEPILSRLLAELEGCETTPVEDGAPD